MLETSVVVQLLTVVIGWFIVPYFLRAIIFRPKKCISGRSLQGKIALVTGANTGLGKVTAADLASRGALVYMACRSMSRAERARQDILQQHPLAKLRIIQLDLGSLASVKACAEKFLAEQSTLDILVANAGFVSWFEYRLTDDGVEWHMGINHLGHFYLTRLLLHCLEKAGTHGSKSRIVVVSSVGHRIGVSKIKYEKLQEGKCIQTAYGQSKLANMLFVKHMDSLLAGRNITINGLHPGIVYTELGRYVIPLSVQHVMSYILFPVYAFLLTDVEGAQTQIWAAVAEELEGVSGRYLTNVSISTPGRAAQDNKEAEQLWNWSCERTGLSLGL